MSEGTSRPQPSFPEELIEGMEERLGPEMGRNKSQIISNIVYAWLSEHGHLDKILDNKDDADEGSS